MNNDRRSFLKVISAALASVGARFSTPIDEFDEDFAQVEATLRLRRFGGETLLMVSRDLPVSIEGVKKMGVSEENLLALANQSIVLKAQAKARHEYYRALDEGMSEEEATRQAEKAFANYAYRGR